MPEIALLVGGLLVLTIGAELLVRGASSLAAVAGISPLVVGLTVVAWGTSAPEVAVSVASAAGGQVDIALGNVIGSNIFNVLFILGAAAAVAPLVVSSQLIRLDVPVMIGVSLLVAGLGLDGRIGRVEGAFLVLLLLGYTAFLGRQGRREPPRPDRPVPAPASGPGPAVSLLLVAAGLGMLVFGSRLFVSGAVALATILGVSELIVGLTVVAAGTSMPELATSVVASFRGEREIAVGNVVGSNIFNILGVLGVSSIVAPGGIPVSRAVMSFDIPVLIAVAVACLPIFFTAHLISRWEGVVFLAYYAAYTTLLYLVATESPHQRLVAIGLGGFAIPLTAMTLGVLAWRAWRQGRAGPGDSG